MSDEGVVEGFLENPYWQYFCGYEYFQHEFPCDPTSLGKWRKRVGPEVECIAKGKAHQRYEFGCKMSVVATSKHGWVVGIDAVHGNPYDGHTLKAAIDQMGRVAGARPKEIFAD